MARPQSVEEQELIGRLSRVFRDVGYEAASLSILAEATGLKKASLYHRFPGGKRQMAEEVLATALGWVAENIVDPLKSDLPPATRIAAVAKRLDGFYEGGGRACLLNMLSAPRGAADGPFAEAIRGAFETLIEAFSCVSRDAGNSDEIARARAERTLMLLHGSLVMSRGLGSSEPFRTFLAGLPAELGIESSTSQGVVQ